MAGVTAALTLGGAALGTVGSIVQGIQGYKAGQENAATYEAQAKNIATAQKITAEQYRTKANVLRGEATTTAARNGLKISGTTANSISQSIMQLQLDNAYEQYNLQVKKQQAYDSASLEKSKARSALMGGFFGAATSALSAGQDYYNKYWKNTGTTTSNSSNKISWGKLTSGLKVGTNKQNQVYASLSSGIN